MAKYIMALDAGTTSNRCILFNEKGEMCSVAQREFTQYFPQPGWVEHDADEIWASMLGVAVESMNKIGATAEDIAAIGITNQRETAIVWDKNTGNPVYHAIVWQCRRTSEYCDTLKSKGLTDKFREKTGLVIDAYFSGTKIKWILDNVEGAREKAEAGDLLFGTVETWLIWKLTKGAVHVTDYSNASRTMLYNISTLDWDKDLLDLFNIPNSMLPKVVNSSEKLGYFNYGGHQIPICAMVGDQQAALFGQTCFHKGAIKNTYGTGCFLLMNTGEEFIHSQQGLVTSIGIGINNKIRYVLEGSVFSAGSIMTWLSEKMEMIEDIKDSSDIALSVNDDENLIMIPSFTGLGAPYWRMDTMASLVNISLNIQSKHVIKAALDSIALHTYDVVQAILEDSQIPIESLYVDGGMASNDYLMMMQANILNKKVIRPQTQETTALGAAYLAGLATGFYKDLDQLKSFTRIKSSYKPTLDSTKRAKILKDWKNAMKHHLSDQT